MATEETNSAKIHTSRTVGPPRQVVADPALSKDEKTEALEALEQDARLPRRHRKKG